MVILHGWTNRRPEGHWQRNLAAALRQQGHQVFYPQLPSTDHPRFADWAEVALGELSLAREANRGEEIIVIAHSLGSVTWLKLVEQGLIDTPISRALLVAPADPDLLLDIADFVIEPASIDASKGAVSTLVVGSDEDHWSPKGVETTFSNPLGVPAVIIPGAKHFALSDGFGEWAGVINWVNDPASDLSVR